MLSISSMRRYIKLDTNSSQHPLESIVTGALGYKCDTTGYYGAWEQSHFAFPFLHNIYQGVGVEILINYHVTERL